MLQHINSFINSGLNEIRNFSWIDTSGGEIDLFSKRIIDKMEKKFQSELIPVGFDGRFTFKIGIEVVGQ